MNRDLYPASYDSSNLLFKFNSVGPRGVITKIIEFKKITTVNENFYSLSLGDWDEKSGAIDFHIVSNNNDTKRFYLRLPRLYCILLTVSLRKKS
jgi:hypothetical protein